MKNKTREQEAHGSGSGSESDRETSTSGSSVSALSDKDRVEVEMRAKINEQAQQLNEQTMLMAELRKEIDVLKAKRDGSSPERKRKNVVAVKASTTGTSSSNRFKVLENMEVEDQEKETQVPQEKRTYTPWKKKMIQKNFLLLDHRGGETTGSTEEDDGGQLDPKTEREGRSKDR